MATVNLSIYDEMKDEFLNDWKNGDVYLVLSSGPGPVVGSKKIVFGNATSTTGGRKIEWIPSGTSGDNGSDFEIPVGTTVTNIILADNGTNVEQNYEYASADINEDFTYGGIVRVDKVTITLT